MELALQIAVIIQVITIILVTAYIVLSEYRVRFYRNLARGDDGPMGPQGPAGYSCPHMAAAPSGPYNIDGTPVRSEGKPKPEGVELVVGYLNLTTDKAVGE